MSPTHRAAAIPAPSLPPDVGLEHPPQFPSAGGEARSPLFTLSK